MNRRPAALLAALLASLAPAAAAPAGPPPAPARTAIVVGANAAALGRAGLRHAHRDSDAMAEVLRSVGRFDARRVHVLHDPAPDEVVRLVEREAAALAGNPQGLLLFYYSGHADRDALYPGGRPLALDRLRAVLDRPDVAVRVGVIDACQGGAWTRAKGLVPDAPFEVTIPAVLGSEGSALIASSSGVESAHESDLLQGSFFTYHFAAALRGAGDQSGDGAVTLTEAYEYARERTIRDSARLSPEPQHPSYALNVRGRQDIVLAHVTDSPSTLAVEQEEGPLELVHLASGLRVLELPAGERSVRLAVPSGKYLVRRVSADGIRTREIEVPRDGAASVREGELVLLGSERVVLKGEGRRAPLSAALSRRAMELGFTGGRLGDSRWDAGFDASLGIGAPAQFRIDGRWQLTDRVTVGLGTLALAYRIGPRGGFGLVPYAGILGWQLGSPVASAATGVQLRPGAGIGLFAPLGPSWAIVAGAGVEAGAVYVGRSHPIGEREAGLEATLGLAARLGDSTSVHLGVAAATASLPGGDGGGLRFRLGSVQELGLARLPLLRFQASPRWSIDLHGYLEGIDVDRYWASWSTTLLAGGSAVF